MPITHSSFSKRFSFLCFGLICFGLMAAGTRAHENGTDHSHMLQLVQSEATESESTDSNTTANTVVVINGKSYSEADLRRSMAHVLDQPGANLQQLYPMILEQFIIERLVSQSAMDQGYADDPRVRAELERALEAIANNFFVSDFLEQQISDDMIAEEYEKFVESLPDTEEVQASHILVASEEEAKAIIALLEDGADFSTLAEEKSTGPSGVNGGNLGYFGKGQMVPAFETAAFAMDVGDFSSVPVKTQFGYHVIKIQDKRIRPKPTLEESRDQLHQQLSESQVQVMVDLLKSDASINRFDLQGNAIEDQQ